MECNYAKCLFYYNTSETHSTPRRAVSLRGQDEDPLHNLNSSEAIGRTRKQPTPNNLQTLLPASTSSDSYRSTIYICCLSSNLSLSLLIFSVLFILLSRVEDDSSLTYVCTSSAPHTYQFNVLLGVHLQASLRAIPGSWARKAVLREPLDSTSRWRRACDQPPRPTTRRMSRPTRRRTHRQLPKPCCWSDSPSPSCLSLSSPSRLSSCRCRMYACPCCRSSPWARGSHAHRDRRVRRTVPCARCCLDAGGAARAGRRRPPPHPPRRSCARHLRSSCLEGRGVLWGAREGGRGC